MSSKSELNKMSKREILHSLMYQQQQDSATTHRLLIAVARAAGLSPEQVAKMFVDNDANREFAGKLNEVIDKEVIEQNKNAAPSANNVEAENPQ